MTAPESKTSKRKLTARERELKALALRMEGQTYASIGARLGISEAGAYKAVMRALGRLNEKIVEQADELRRLELERLDKMLSCIWWQVESGNQGGIDRALKIMQRRADLLGLDAPKRTDITSGGQAIHVVPIGIDVDKL